MLTEYAAFSTGIREAPLTPRSLRRSRRHAALLGAGALTLVPFATAGGAAVSAAALPTGHVAADHHTAYARYILRLATPVSRAGRAVEAALAADGGRVLAVQPALGTEVVEASADAAARLARLRGVLDVVPDAVMRPTSLGFSPSSQPGALTNVTRLTGAQALWMQGYTGNGVDVALIDTGVAPVPALSSSTKVVVGPDLSFESQDPDLRYLDTFGHGTNMAGIIAGREGPAASGTQYAADAGNTFYGMAPDARLISLKLADRNGLVDVSQMIAAIDWVVQHRATDGMNVRVLNLSYGTPSANSAARDPLAWAAETAVRKGILVVASAGNDGSQLGLADPAYDPWVLAVGAADTGGTDTLSDDVVASFSTSPMAGSTARAADLVAPGVGIVAPGVVGSYLYDTYPGARVGDGYLRGSGTSQAAAVVSGAAALIAQEHPSWGPLLIKQALRATASWLPGEDAARQGNGELNLVAASTYVSTWVPIPAIGTGLGQLELTRNGHDLFMDGVPLIGEQDIMGASWNDFWMALATGFAVAWNGGTFNGNDWTGSGFTVDTTSWAGKTWSGKTWSGKTWTGTTWSGKTWTGKTWSTATWSDSGWTAAAWPSPVDTPEWASSIWSTFAWG
jgi:serine protease AprX